MKRTLFRFAILAFVSSSMLFGHDPSKHHGRPISGTVEKLTDKGMDLKTDKGTRTIIFTDKTTFENGDQKITRADLKPEEHVLVFGTVLPNDQVYAKEVLLAPSNPQAAQSAHKH